MVSQKTRCFLLHSQHAVGLHQKSFQTLNARNQNHGLQVHKKHHLLSKYFFLLLPFHKKKNSFSQCNVLVKTCDRINVRIGIRTFELKIQIIKHSRRSGITQKYCFQRPRSRNKSVFHDVYIRPKGTELSFP